MLSVECIKNEKSVYFLLTSARGLGFGQLAPLHRVCCPNILLADRRGAGFGTFKTQNRGDQPTSPPPPTKKSPYGLFFANSFYIRRN